MNPNYSSLSMPGISLEQCHQNVPDDDRWSNSCATAATMVVRACVRCLLTHRILYLWKRVCTIQKYAHMQQNGSWINFAYAQYGIFSKICPKHRPNVDTYTIHGAYGYRKHPDFCGHLILALAVSFGRLRCTTLHCFDPS